MSRSPGHPIAPPRRAGRPLRAFTAGSLERIRPEAAARRLVAARLWAARGESESFQVAVRGPARGVTAAMGTLTGPGRGGDPGRERQLYREQAVLVEHSTTYSGGPNPPEASGEIPDALIPFSAPGGRLRAQPFAVEAGRNAVIFADVACRARPARASTAAASCCGARTAPAGRSRWSSPSGASPCRPRRHSARRSASGMRPAGRPPRCCCATACSRARSCARDVAALRPLGLTAAGLPFWSGAATSSCSFGAPPSAREVRRAVRSLGAGLRLYDYTADEIDGCPGAVDGLRAWGRALHAAGRQAARHGHAEPELLDDGSGRPAVDIWVLGPNMAKAAAPYLPAVRAAGGQIWSYTALAPDPAAPIWTIDEPLINERILPGFLGHALGATGVLYWRIDDFGNGDPWTAVTDSVDSGESFPVTGSSSTRARPSASTASCRRCASRRCATARRTTSCSGWRSARGSARQADRIAATRRARVGHVVAQPAPCWSARACASARCSSALGPGYPARARAGPLR